MILDCKIGESIDKMTDGFIELSTISSAESAGENNSLAMLVGGGFRFIELNILELKEKVRAAHMERMGYSSSVSSIENKKIFKEIEVGSHKFRLDINESTFNDETNYTLRLHANFSVKNSVLGTMVEYVLGVEKFCDFSWYKYEGVISIGKMFDVETVRADVEKKIIEFLTDNEN